MKTMFFSTDGLPEDRRLAAFRASTVHFAVEALGNPAAFHVDWRMATVGDLNLLHSRTSPLRYRRDDAMIAQDGEDRVAIHVRIAGTTSGHVAGVPGTTSPGEAILWDTAHPLEQFSHENSDILIVTMPRYMIAEVLPGDALPRAPVGGPAVARAAAYLRFVLDHAEALPEASGPHHARALRDLFGAAFLPLVGAVDARSSAAIDRMRLNWLIDADLTATHGLEPLGAALGAPPGALATLVGGSAGLARLVERRRLLAAYRLLSSPAEAGSIGSIASRCGFGDLANFSRGFHAVFGKSPRGLRRHAAGTLPAWAGAFDVTSLFSPLLER